LKTAKFATFPVSQGYHNFQWIYYKDHSVSSGEDAARLTQLANWTELLFTWGDEDILLTGDYDAQVGKFADGAEQVICICCSSKVSATYQAALMAVEAFPERDITVMDSLNLCLAEGFQVINAAETAARGAGKDEVLAAVHSLQGRTHVFAALPTLKYLAMGGRMGKLAAGFGETLNIKPILTSKDGKLDLLEKVRTWRKAKQRLVELAMESSADKEIERIGLIQVNDEPGVMALYDLIKEVLPISVEPIVADFTPGLSVHTGSGVIGFVLITKEV